MPGIRRLEKISVERLLVSPEVEESFARQTGIPPVRTSLLGTWYKPAADALPDANQSLITALQEVKKSMGKP
jgi:hypothetical protein